MNAVRRDRIAFGVVTSLSGLLVWGAAACSSVPDVEFVDDDAGTRVDGATGSSSGRDANGADTAAPAALCAPGSTAAIDGVCCGALPCFLCGAGDCGDCEAKCRATTGACRKNGPNNMKCVDPLKP